MVKNLHSLIERSSFICYSWECTAREPELAQNFKMALQAARALKAGMIFPG
jgi:hypothetical protein